MLTIAILMEAITNPSKLKISQNKLAESFNTTPSTINAWIKKNSQPKMSAETIYDGINHCRMKWTPYQNDSVFIEKIINSLAIDQSEKDSLNVQYNIYKNKYPSSEACCKQFLLHLIQLALDQSEIRTSLQYDASGLSRPVVGIGIEHVIAALSDGRVLSTGANDFQQCAVTAWRDVVSVSAGWRSSIGLKSDGTCIAVGRSTVGNGEMAGWNNLSAVCCGTFHFLGLKRDGTVVAYGLGGDGQCNVSGWSQIKALAAGTGHSVGLRQDGTVVACGSNREGQCEVSSWKNVVQIAAAGDHTVGLTADGTVLYAGFRYIYNFSDWKDVRSIATGTYHIVGLKSDGTILHTGNDVAGLDGVYKWWDIAAVYAGFNTTVGIKTDGSVCITNDKHSRIWLDSSSWNIYGERGRTDSGDSPFETARKEILASFSEIHDLGLTLSPSLHGAFLDSDSAELLESLRAKTKDIYEKSMKIKQIKPLFSMASSFAAAFCGFYDTFSFDEEKRLYCLSDKTYEAYIDFLTAARITMGEIRSL